MSFSYGSDEIFAKPPEGMGAPTRADVATTVTHAPETPTYSPEAVKQLLSELAEHPPEVGAEVMRIITEQGITDQAKIAFLIEQALAERKIQNTTLVIEQEKQAERVEVAALQNNNLLVKNQTVLTTGRHYRGEAEAPVEFMGLHVQRRDANQRFPWKELGDTLKYIASLTQGFQVQAGLPGKTRAVGLGVGA